MDKKEARLILGVTKETSRNDIERKYSILLKKHRMTGRKLDDEEAENTDAPDNIETAGDAADARNLEKKQEELDFDRITQAYNILMGYEVTIKEEPPSKAAPLLKKAGIDEKKARNFFYYYKYHLIAVLAVVVSVVFIVKGCVTRVEPDFTTAFIGNISYSDTDKLKSAIQANVPEIKEPGFDGAFLVDGDMNEQQYAMVMKATILFAAGGIDLFVMDKANFEKYAKNGAFVSLDEIAPRLGVDMEKNKDYILSVEEPSDETGDGAAEKAPKEPAQKHLYGIDISNSKVLKESGVLGNEMIAAIYINGKQTDKAVKLLEFLLK